MCVPSEAEFPGPPIDRSEFLGGHEAPRIHDARDRLTHLEFRREVLTVKNDVVDIVFGPLGIPTYLYASFERNICDAFERQGIDLVVQRHIYRSVL